ncbi:cytochrome P450 [Favolaschia claudopus]|uniref:Cytochrome P450 n=1 Tax=Favolaschia claudopus TaxID=2862362 RepID=A0AAW0AII8_9AGAR
MTSWTPPSYLAALFIVFVVHRILVFRRNARKLAHLPGLRSLFSPASPFGALIPTSFWNPGLNWLWLWRNQVYPKYNLDTISNIPYLAGIPAIYTRSMESARQILAVKGGQFFKNDDTTLVLRPYGHNLVTVNGSEWSRHRRIMNPAFTPETYAFVWEEAANLYAELMKAEGWVDQEEVFVPVVEEITTKFALLLISRCAFGHSIPWNAEEDPNKSTEAGMPFAEAISIVSRSAIPRLVIPGWMYMLPIKSLRDIQTAHTTLESFLRDLIRSRREELSLSQPDNTKGDRKDVFRLLLQANEGEETLHLSDEELIGNTHLLMNAGHETTAKTLQAAIGFLALYEDIQEEAYQEIQEVLRASDSDDIAFKDYPKLVKVQSCFLEASRLFPAASAMYRETASTVALKTDDTPGHEVILEVGTWVIVDSVGLHHNPKYFPDPEEFRPSRWYGVGESDYSTFSLGPRACIGRRFALTESVRFISSLLLDWRLHIILNEGESREEWRKRVMRGAQGLTFGVGGVPVRLTRR